MSKAYVDEDEWFPVYTIKVNSTYKSDVEIELTEEEIRYIQEVTKKFREVQELLYAKVREPLVK